MAEIVRSVAPPTLAAKSTVGLSMVPPATATPPGALKVTLDWPPTITPGLTAMVPEAPVAVRVMSPPAPPTTHAPTRPDTTKLAAESVTPLAVIWPATSSARLSTSERRPCAVTEAGPPLPRMNWPSVPMALPDCVQQHIVGGGAGVGRAGKPGQGPGTSDVDRAARRLGDRSGPGRTVQRHTSVTVWPGAVNVGRHGRGAERNHAADMRWRRRVQQPDPAGARVGDRALHREPGQPGVGVRRVGPRKARLWPRTGRARRSGFAGVTAARGRRREAGPRPACRPARPSRPRCRLSCRPPPQRPRPPRGRRC